MRSTTNKYLQKCGTTIGDLLSERDAEESLRSQDREVLLVIVGTGRAPGLDRMVQYLTDRYAVPISAVSFDLFELQDGTRLMSREIHEADQAVEAVQRRTQITPQDVLNVAHNSGIGGSFAAIHDAALALGLYPRTWKTSIMYASPKNRTRMLFTVWARPQEARLRVYVGHASFAEFYDASADLTQQYLGPEGYKLLTLDQAQEFARQLRAFFEALKANTQTTLASLEAQE